MVAARHSTIAKVPATLDTDKYFVLITPNYLSLTAVMK